MKKPAVAGLLVGVDLREIKSVNFSAIRRLLISATAKCGRGVHLSVSCVSNVDEGSVPLLNMFTVHFLNHAFSFRYFTILYCSNNILMYSQ